MRHNKGFLLITSLLVLTGLATLMTISLSRSMTELMVSNRFVASQQAFYLAENGIDCAINDLRRWGSLDKVPRACNRASAPGGSVTVQLTAVLGTTNLFTLTSTGTATSSSVNRSIAAVLRLNVPPPFQQAIYATKEDTTRAIRLYDGALVNSYDSRLGDYNEWISSEGRFNIAVQGVVYTSNARSVAVDIWLGAKLHGHAYTANPDPNSSYPYGVRVATWEAAEHIGDKRYSDPSPRTFPSAPVPERPSSCKNLDELLALDPLEVGEPREFPEANYCASNLTVSQGRTLQFPNLNHLYVRTGLGVEEGGSIEVGQGLVSTQNLVIEGSGSSFEGTSGQVDLYVGQLSVNDYAVMQGANQLPKNLRIFRAGTGDIAIVNSHVYGVIYAPDVLVDVSDPSASALTDYAKLFGAAIGREVAVQAATLHFDEALQNVTNWPAWLSTTGTTVEVLSWQDSP